MNYFKGSGMVGICTRKLKKKLNNLVPKSLKPNEIENTLPNYHKEIKHDH